MAAGGANAPAAKKRNGRRRRYCRPRPLCCRLAALHHQKPSENGRSIPIFDGEARNTAHALGSEACGDHILQRHACSSNAHCVPIVSGMTFFYQNIKKSARVSSPAATTFEGILACGSMVLSVYVYRYFARRGEKRHTKTERTMLPQAKIPSKVVAPGLDTRIGFLLF